MTQMSMAEKQAFLADLHVGIIGLTHPEQGPLTVPIWYDYEPGGKLWVITGAQSRKGQLMQLGTRLSLCAQTEDPPYRYVSVEGPITDIQPTQADQLLSMAVRYLGDVQGRAYAEGSTLENQWTVSITPERWLAVDYGKLP